MIIRFLEMLIYNLFLISTNVNELFPKSCRFIIANVSFSKLFIQKTFQKLFFLLLFFEEALGFCIKNFNEGSILRIYEDPEDHFNSKIKQIIKLSAIFNNQTERIADQYHKFVAESQPYLR